MLKQSLTYQLASIAENGIGNATQIFERRFGLNVYEIRVMRLIRDNPGITFTKLARLTQFERTATSRMLSRLIKSGLVSRTNSTSDARQFTLTTTSAGLAVCRKADPLSLELEELMLEPLSDKQKEVFRRMLETVLEWVNTGYPERVRQRFPEADLVRRRAAATGQGTENSSRIGRKAS